MSIVALILAIVAWQRLAPTGRASGTLSINVPGAMNLAVYCGGEVTHFADGEWIEFVPESTAPGTVCELEAPLSGVMPVRGQVVLDGSSRYHCVRQAMEYRCSSR